MTGESCHAEESAENGEMDQEATLDGRDSADDGEFQITIRKLELPVRPRGVLAE